jgi:hypothetical protein
MEDILLEMAAGAASNHLQTSMKREDLDILQDWKGMAQDLFNMKSKEDFWTKSGILRQKKDFVKPIKDLISIYKV